ERLLDVSLQQRDAQRRALRRAPCDVTQCFADADDHYQRAEPIHCSRTARRQEPERAGERQREKAKREYAAERRVALERPTDRCIAERKPRKTAQDPGAQPLEESPRRRDQQARADEGI